jgi:PAS domain S-box-containing protein
LKFALCGAPADRKGKKGRPATPAQRTPFSGPVRGVCRKPFRPDFRPRRRPVQRYQKIERKLIANEQTLSQIVQGSTIPTFVIDKDHRVTYWNRACERLTGYPADKIVGTRDQWKPFREKKRPVMADLILDGVNEEDVWRYYGARWKKSALIEGANEAEEYFPHLGFKGKWLFFTAAPIKGPDGTIVGAIQTLWDKTLEKEAAQERENHNRELRAKTDELEASEAAMHEIIRGSTIPTFVIDRDHRVTHWNRALEILSGYRAREIVGTRKQWLPFYKHKRPSMADVILDQPDKAVIQKLYGEKWRPSALVEGGYEAEKFFPDLGENGKWCWFTAAPIKRADGTIVGAIETLWDKTEEKKAEEEQLRHTQELSTLCSIYATLSAPLDLEGRVNAAIKEVTDIFLADGICIFLLGEDGRFHLKYNFGYSENVCRLDQSAEEESPIVRVANEGKLRIFEQLPADDSEEIRLMHKERFQSLVYIPILDKDKITTGVIRIGSTEHRRFNAEDRHVLELFANRIGVAIENARLEKENHRRANFQAKLIKSSNNGIVATGRDGKVVIYNPEAERLFGYSRDEVIGHLGLEDLVPEELRKEGEAGSTAGVTGAETPWHETVITSKGGERIPARFSGAPLFEAGKPMGSVAFFQDLREIKRLERELVNSERLAAIGQTVAGMAHCIKNILHGFKGGSYLLNIGIDRDNPDKLKAGWGMIQRNITRTSDLVLDLLSYSKQREPEMEVCHPGDIVREVQEILSETAAEHEIALDVSVADDMPAVLLDPRSVRRSLMNLVSNGIDACIFDDDISKHHRVCLSTAVEGDETIRFAISDNGHGMDEEVRKKLFASFFSTKGAKGTGLGLLVTRKLIQEHNGTIEVQSEVGVGTTFTIRFPYAKEGFHEQKSTGSGR